MSNKLSNLVESYMAYLKYERNSSLKTLENYSLWLNRFIEFSGDINPKDISPFLVLDYRRSLDKL
jgi:site-specific recombinase XerC